MNIGIDARLIDETGVGRYIGNLVAELGTIDKEHHYVVFFRKKSFDHFLLPNKRWSKRLADVPWHSFSEQLVMPGIFFKENLDLVHIPYFNVPIFYPGKFIVTIHDLTILHFDTGKASTLPLPLYKLRRLGYWIALYIGLHRAVKIIAVSETTKKEIIDHFHVGPDKIVVTYEGVDEVRSDKREAISKIKLIQDPYFLYVGNAYPHKNLEMLLKAFQTLTTYSSQPTAKLILVGAKDYFYDRLVENMAATKLRYSVILSHDVSDEDLIGLYKNAIALVFPSLMEGFGLPGLEAMAAGTPVVCSDIPVFHEIYGDAALYFDPKNENDIISSLKAVGDSNIRKNLIEKGLVQVKKYSWEKMARRTQAIF